MSRKTFTYKEVIKASKEYFCGDEFVAKVFVDKYCMRNEEDEFVDLNPDDLHDRLASEFSRIDKVYGEDYDERFSIYRDALDKFKRIVPQGSVMSAIGNNYKAMSASNCVVVESPKDSIDSIFDTAKETAQLYKRRCGVGLDLSNLRPEGFSVSNAAKTTSGAWSFADFYSHVTRLIGQSGRRGATMLTIDVHHPDILSFIKMKEDNSKVTGANISVQLTDEFLEAVDKESDYEQRWPVKKENKKYSKMVSAKLVWDAMVESATNSAEPGLMFIDTIRRELPADYYKEFRTVTTNPCGEIPLGAYGSCRLTSINLTGYVVNPFMPDAYFDFTSFISDTKLAMQILDNVVDLELENIIRIQEEADSSCEKETWQKLYNSGKNGRRTGLGTHGVADALAQLRITYDSDEGIKMLEKIYECFRDSAYSASVDLAEKRGAFPVYSAELEKDCPFLKRLPSELRDRMSKVGRRNISILTQAPTGSVSILSKCGEFNSHNISSGVEPVFMKSYVRRKKVNSSDSDSRVDFVDDLGDSWQEFKVYHGNVKNYLDVVNGDDDTILPDFFVTSGEINWEKRIEIQMAEQKFIDHSISSTINLPRGTQKEVVGAIYMHAWKMGLKGITVYVDGSRDGVMISETNTSEVDESGRPLKISYVQSPRRPETLECEIYHSTNKGIPWTVLLGKVGDAPYEIFMGHSKMLSLPKKYKNGKITKVKRGKYDLFVDVDGEDLIVKDIVKAFDNPDSAWATRMISLSLRHGTPLEFIVEQLAKDGGIADVNKVCSRILKKFLKNGSKVKSNGGECSECGDSSLIYVEGCVKCNSCGYSKCG